MTNQIKTYLFFFVIFLILLVVNIILSIKNNQFEGWRILSNIFLILVFSLIIYKELKKLNHNNLH